MSLQQITLEYLEKEVWWWRPGATKHPCGFQKNPFDLKTPAPLQPIYDLAFNYELARRVKRVAEPPLRLVPFTELGPPHLWIIGPLLGVSPIIQLGSRDAGNERQESERGWTQLFPKRQWNLQVSNRTLIEAFKALIQNQRQIQGIQASRPLASIRKRPVSWRWLELIDISEHGLEKLNDSERHSLSTARRESKRQGKLFDEAIDQYWEMHNSPEDDEDPNCSEEFRLDPLEIDGWIFTPAIVQKPLWRHIWPLEEVEQ